MGASPPMARPTTLEQMCPHHHRGGDKLTVEVGKDFAVTGTESH